MPAVKAWASSQANLSIVKEFRLIENFRSSKGGSPVNAESSPSYYNIFTENGRFIAQVSSSQRLVKL